MRLKLYVELASRIKDERILDLFRFPVDATMAAGARWWSTWWSQGRTRRNQSNDREAIFSKIAQAGFNELTLSCKTGPTKPSRRAEFTDAWIYTQPSPRSVLWAPVPEMELKSIPEDRKRFNFARAAQAVQGRTVTTASGRPRFIEDKKAPVTEVQYLLGVEAPERVIEHHDVQRTCVELIRSAIPPALEGCDLFGYACAGANCRCMGMVVGVGMRGGLNDELGEKFENIYPILIGPKTSCEGLAAALGSGEKWPLFSGDQSPTYILSIPPQLSVPPFPRKAEVFPPCASDPAVRRWLVLGSSDGEWKM
jgi:hypothetical protein